MAEPINWLLQIVGMVEKRPWLLSAALFAVGFVVCAVVRRPLSAFLLKRGVAGGGVPIVIAALASNFGAVCLSAAHMARANPQVAAIVAPEWARLLPPLFLLPALAVAHAFIGAARDRSMPPLHPPRRVLAAQLLTATAFVVAAFLAIHLLRQGPDTAIELPLGAPLLLMAVVVAAAVAATGEAARVADGLRAFVPGAVVLAALVLAATMEPRLAGEDLVQSQGWFFAAALAGAAAAFLIFSRGSNSESLGAAGALALGAALAGAFVLCRATFLLLFAAPILFVELALSMQKRARFERAPLQSRLRLKGWSEGKVLVALWGASAVSGAVGVALWRAGVVPRLP